MYTGTRSSPARAGRQPSHGPSVRQEEGLRRGRSGPPGRRGASPRQREHEDQQEHAGLPHRPAEAEAELAAEEGV